MDVTQELALGPAKRPRLFRDDARVAFGECAGEARRRFVVLGGHDEEPPFVLDLGGGAGGCPPPPLPLAIDMRGGCKLIAVTCSGPYVGVAWRRAERDPADPQRSTGRVRVRVSEIVCTGDGALAERGDTLDLAGQESSVAGLFLRRRSGPAPGALAAVLGAKTLRLYRFSDDGAAGGTTTSLSALCAAPATFLWRPKSS